MIQLLATCGCGFRISSSNVHTASDTLLQAAAHADGSGHRLTLTGSITADDPKASKHDAKDRSALERHMLRSSILEENKVQGR